MNFDTAMFHSAFFEEAADLLEDLEGLLLRLEKSPDDLELLNTIFRCAHSIKGGSATFGFADLAQFTHGLETLLDLMRNGQLKISKTISQLLLESRDQMRALLAVARGEESTAPDSAPLTARIHEQIESVNGTSDISAITEEPVIIEETAITAATKVYRLKFVPGPDILRRGIDPRQMINQIRESGELISIICDTSRLPSIEEIDPESSYLGWEIIFRTEWEEAQILDIFEFIEDESEIVLTIEPADFIPVIIQEVSAAAETIRAETSNSLNLDSAPLSAAKPTPPQPAAATPTSGGKNSDTQTLRVATDKVDKLINLVGELIINQSMLNEVISDFSMAKLPRLIEAVAEMERASRDLQERVMAVRMLPIKYAFGRFPRLVHDLSVACGKKIELKTVGEDTELDKTVIEVVTDPLTHLVRNSIDHALETPEERRAAGKPEMGTITLNAFHEGGNIVIEVSDDGRGLNRERILQKAIDRGLISENDAPPADDILYNYIFHPGFSTAKEVTDLSGRGVGMDIVKRAVQALGGSISLNTVPGKGTRFRIKLPLTMAILEGLSLSVGEEVYILPLTSIVESIRPKLGDVRLVAGQGEIVLMRGEVLPILRLYQVFGSTAQFTDPTKALLVIVENDGRKVALLVDELIGQSQVVIKSLETNYRKVNGIAGATILGDGRVALILDVPGLIHTDRLGGASFAEAA